MNNSITHRSVVIKSLFGVVVMFMFAIFVLPPLYDLFCEITGIGGKTGDVYTATEITVDTSGITVEESSALILDKLRSLKLLG